MLHSFRIDSAGLEGIVFLIQRQGLNASGDLESGFLADVARLKRHRGGIGQVAAELAAEPGTVIVALVRNPGLVLDTGLRDRIAAARRRLACLADGWSLAAAGGLTPDGNRVSTLYSSASPHLPLHPEPAPLVDALPDLVLAEAGWLTRLAGRGQSMPDTALEPILAVEGYLEGRVALYIPELVAGVDGGLWARDPLKLRRELQAWFGETLPGDEIPTLTGPVAIEPAADDAGLPVAPLAEIIAEVVAGRCDPLALSIVTRTRFDRPHLLRRLLSSITRARCDGGSIEVILSSDASRETCEAALEELRADFVNLRLRLCRNPARGHSRVTNLIAGIRAATADYVAVMDDDDYVDLFAFEEMERALFLGARPLMVTGSDVHDEEWIETASGAHVLVAQGTRATYPASEWRRMFGGVNRLPICAMVMPRERLVARLDTFDFRHDLSEDYALHLLVLTDPELPAIVELPGTFGHISIRKDETHSMTLEDRRPWVRDIALYLSDLARSPGTAGPGKWMLLAGHETAAARLEAGSIAELEAALAARERELRLMRLEIERLRSAEAAPTVDLPATDLPGAELPAAGASAPDRANPDFEDAA